MPHDDATESATAPSGVAAPRSRTAAGGVFASLSISQYRRYLLSFFGSGYAFQNQNAVRGWLAFELTGEALSIGAVLAASGVAQAVAAPIGGVLADRFDRKRLMIGMQAIILVVAVFIGILVVTDAIRVWHLYATAAVSGFAMSIHMPSRQAFVYDIVGGRHIANAIALNAGLNNSMRLIGPAVAGVVIAFFGIGTAYFMTAAAYVLSITVLLVFIGPTNQQFRVDPQSPLRDFREGLRYLWGRRTIFWLVILGLGASTLGLPYRDMMPAFAVDALGQDAKGWGLLLSMAGLGALIGSVVIAATADSVRKGPVILWVGVVWGALFALMAIAPNMPVAILFLLGLGATSTAFNTLINISIQTNVEDAFRGRMLSFYMLTFSVHPMGALAIGALADAIGIRQALFGAGLVMLAFALVMSVTRRDIRRLS